MAIAKVSSDSTSQNTSLSYSITHTLVSGSDRLIIVGLSVANSDTISVSSITYGGVTMTLAAQYLSGTSGARNLTGIWYLLNASLPTDGSKSVAVTLSGTASSLQTITFCAEYTGVSQTAPEATNTAYETSLQTVTNAISPSTGAWVISVVSSGASDGSWTPNESQIEVSESISVALQELRSASGQTSLSSTYSGTVTREIRIAASFAAAVSSQVPSYIYQINCGGSAATPYSADQFFSGGTTVSVGNTITIPGSLSVPAPQAVYQAERYGNMTYTITGLTAYKRYLVRLHFSENYWTGANQRLFDVSINSTLVLDNFDVYVAAGNAQFTAIIREFYTNANSSGQIVIQFTTVTDNAVVMGIEIWTAPTNIWVNVTGTWKEVTDVYVNNAGSWSYVNASYVNVAGTWDQVNT
jgi:hypothetical protein